MRRLEWPAACPLGKPVPLNLFRRFYLHCKEKPTGRRCETIIQRVLRGLLDDNGFSIKIFDCSVTLPLGCSNIFHQVESIADLIKKRLNASCCLGVIVLVD